MRPALSPRNCWSTARARTPLRLLLLAVLVRHVLAARLADATARADDDEPDNSRICPQLLPTYSFTPPPTKPPSTTRPVSTPRQSLRPSPSAAPTATGSPAPTPSPAQTPTTAPAAPAQTPSTAPDITKTPAQPPPPPRKQASTRDARVIGGAAAAPGLELSLAFLGRCTGALIAPAIVASAAHCPVVAGDRVVLNARAGYADAAQSEPFSRATRRVRRVVRPDAYLAELDQKITADLLVVYLDTPAPNASVPMRVNSDPALPRARAAVRVAGYGSTKYDEFSETSSGNYASELYQVDLPVVGLQQCNRMMGANLEGPGDFCAGYARGGCDSCQGDSGGPVFQLDPTGRPVLVGVVSRGSGCGLRNKPGVNTRVASFIQLFSDNSIVKTDAAVQVLSAALEPEPEYPGPQGSDVDDDISSQPVFNSVILGILVFLGICLMIWVGIFAYRRLKSRLAAQDE